jgi:hypothetical protein
VASPQTEDGFVMIALDLFAAMMSADLPNRCQIVLGEALLELYGPRKARSVYLVPSTLEDHTGLHRNNARRAIRELTEWSILLPQSDGSFKFNKDYGKWRISGQAIGERLGGGLLKFALSALARHGKEGTHKRKAQSNGIQVSPLTSIQRDSGIPTYLNPTGLTLTPPPLEPPIEEARASEELEIKEQTDRQTDGRAAIALVNADGTASPLPGDEAPALEDRHARLRQVIDAAAAAYGEPGERWAASYSHEYPDHDRLLRAIGLAGDVVRAGGRVRSFGGLVRTKYETLDQPASEWQANRGRPETRDEAKAARDAKLLAALKQRGLA